ncbi:MAG TPA: multicopper oxidase domain-containing protein, partial [Chitinophagaceae bacterium]|nr:multicopper oxidase domain-containing protein [Chitinophagaceae bacterium]
SSARYFLLSLGGKEFQIIATDGGLIEKPVTVTKALIVPGERLDILSGPFSQGEKIPLLALKYDRMTFLKAKRNQFATINIGESKPSIAVMPNQLRTIEPIADRDAEVTRQIKLSVVPSIKRGIDFVVNNQMHANEAPVNVGELQVWEISNTSMMDHPWHLHGFFFQVLEENGQVPEYKAWKDTINLKPRSKVKIAWMPDNRPGMWMHHCHILEHHAAGMMANFEVVDPSKGEQHKGQHSCHGSSSKIGNLSKSFPNEIILVEV